MSRPILKALVSLGQQGRVQMRPNSIRSEYEARAQRQRMSTFKRGAGSTIGPKILLAAVVVVAGAIGISGIYPKAIDAEWTQDSGTHLPKIPLLTTSTTIKASATATALSSPHVVTTGQTAGSPPRSAPAPAPEVSPLGTSVAAVALAPAPTAAAPLALAEIPDAEAEAKAPATQPSPAKAVDKQTKVVKGKVAQHHQRSFSAAYAQYGGWGWFGFGGYRRF
jgi:hypothetical protein